MRTLVAIALALGLPAGALAQEVTGRLGLRYDRLDTWEPGGAHAASPLLQLDADVAGRGYWGGPEVLRWDVGAAYEYLRASYPGYEEGSDSWTGRLGLGLFQHPTAKLSLSADASRSVSDSQLTMDAGARQTGTTTDNTYRLMLNVQDPARPAIWLGGWRRENSNSGFGRAETTETTNQMEAGVQHGPGPYTYSLTYSGRYNEGSLPVLNYDLHTVMLNGSTRVDPVLTAFISTQYRLRLPKEVAGINPRTEDNRVTAGARWSAPDTVGNSQYVYTHVQAESPTLAPTESIRNAFNTWADHAFTPDWHGVFTVDLAHQQDRVGTSETSASGQTLDAIARYQRPWRGGGGDLLAEFGPKLGFIEPAGGGVDVGWGAMGRVRPTWLTERSRYALDYRIEYQSDLYAVQGWSLTQNATAEAETLIAPDLRARAYLLATSSRRSLALLGDSAARRLSLEGSILWRLHEVRLEGGTEDGISGAVDSIASDGLFLPASYNTHARWVLLTGRASVTRALGVTARARYATLSGPEYPEQRQLDLGAALYYQVGLFRLSLEDRWLAAGATGLDNRSNQIFLRASRNFGVRF